MQTPELVYSIACIAIVLIAVPFEIGETLAKKLILLKRLLKMDNTTKAILAVIAIALCAITLKLYTSSPPTYGDFLALKNIEDIEKKKEQRIKLMEKLPMVRVHGGMVDAYVQGSVSID